MNCWENKKLFRFDILLIMYHYVSQQRYHHHKQLIPEQNNSEYNPMYQLVYDQQVMPHPKTPPDLHPHPQAQ
jgi:hypothetical protein